MSEFLHRLHRIGEALKTGTNAKYGLENVWNCTFVYS
jgi:hypothetical protein